MASRFTSRVTSRFPQQLPQARSLARRMTLQLSAALILFAGLQLWAVAIAVDAGAPRFFTLLAILVICGVAIPVASRIERRWSALGSEALPSRSLCARFYRETMHIWLAAALVPLAWVATLVAANAAVSALLH